MRPFWLWVPGAIAFLVATAALMVLLFSPSPSTPVPSPAAASSPTTSTTIVLSPTQQFFADLRTANLPILVNDAYTEEAAVKEPCSAAAEGLPWSAILTLDENLPVGPSEYGRMAAIGIQDECPRYLPVVPPAWLPSR